MSEIQSPNCNTEDLHKHQDYHTVNIQNILEARHFLYMLKYCMTQQADTNTKKVNTHSIAILTRN